MSTTMKVTRCTVVYTVLTNSDGRDGLGGDLPEIPLEGEVTLTADLPDYSPIPGKADGIPVGLVPRTWTGYIEDGVLKDSKGGIPGVRVWASDPDAGEPLVYRVRFNLQRPDGTHVRVDGGEFTAPTSDSVVNLRDVLLPSVNRPGGGSTGGSSGGGGSTDFGVAGRKIAKANTGPDAFVAMGGWSTLGDIPDANMPDYATKDGLARAKTIPDIRDWNDRTGNPVSDWRSRLGAAFTAGQKILTCADPFTARDIGKTCILGGGSQAPSWTPGPTMGAFWVTTIVDVDRNGVATISDAAPTTQANARMQYGHNNTAVINGALMDVAQDTSSRRALRLVGRQFLDQLQVPLGTSVEGLGWGKHYGGYDWWSGASTLLCQLPGAEKDFVVFYGGDFLGQSFAGPGRFSNMMLRGPQRNAGRPVTTGSGIALVKADGGFMRSQDGFILEYVHVTGFPGDGIKFYGGAVPGIVRDCRAFFNDGFGFNYVAQDATSTDAPGVENFSGDGNKLGLIRLKGLVNHGSGTNNSTVVINNAKSESSNLRQNSAIILEDCEGPVIINGVCHYAGYGPAGTKTFIGEESNATVNSAGPAIVIRSTTGKRPSVIFSGIGNRLQGTETGNVADTVTLRDEVAGYDIPADISSGHYSPASRPRLGGATRYSSGQPVEFYRTNLPNQFATTPVEWESVMLGWIGTVFQLMMTRSANGPSRPITIGCWANANGATKRTLTISPDVPFTRMSWGSTAGNNSCPSVPAWLNPATPVTRSTTPPSKTASRRPQARGCWPTGMSTASRSTPSTAPATSPAPAVSPWAETGRCRARWQPSTPRQLSARMLATSTSACWPPARCRPCPPRWATARSTASRTPPQRRLRCCRPSEKSTALPRSRCPRVRLSASFPMARTTSRSDNPPKGSK